MSSTNDYSSLTLDELRAEETKQKSYRIPSALFLGFLVGIAVFAAVKGKFFLVIMVLAGVIILANRSGDALKKVQAENKEPSAASLTRRASMSYQTSHKDLIKVW